MVKKSEVYQKSKKKKRQKKNRQKKTRQKSPKKNQDRPYLSLAQERKDGLLRTERFLEAPLARQGGRELKKQKNKMLKI